MLSTVSSGGLEAWRGVYVLWQPPGDVRVVGRAGRLLHHPVGGLQFSVGYTNAGLLEPRDLLCGAYRDERPCPAVCCRRTDRRTRRLQDAVCWNRGFQSSIGLCDERRFKVSKRRGITQNDAEDHALCKAGRVGWATVRRVVRPLERWSIFSFSQSGSILPSVLIGSRYASLADCGPSNQARQGRAELWANRCCHFFPRVADPFGCIMERLRFERLFNHRFGNGSTCRVGSCFRRSTSGDQSSCVLPATPYNALSKPREVPKDSTTKPKDVCPRNEERGTTTRDRNATISDNRPTSSNSQPATAEHRTVASGGGPKAPDSRPIASTTRRLKSRTASADIQTGLAGRRSRDRGRVPGIGGSKSSGRVTRRRSGRRITRLLQRTSRRWNDHEHESLPATPGRPMQTRGWNDLQRHSRRSRHVGA